MIIHFLFILECKVALVLDVFKNVEDTVYVSVLMKMMYGISEDFLSIPTIAVFSNGITSYILASWNYVVLTKTSLSHFFDDLKQRYCMESISFPRTILRA